MERSRGKKFFLLTICIFLGAFCAFAFCGCSLSYDFEDVNGLGIGYSESENRAFISTIEWKGGDSKEIVLPCDYNGIAIKELGGYFGTGVPCPFGIDIDIENIYTDADRYLSVDDEDIWDETLGRWTEKTVEDYDFIITLPKHLEDATYISACSFVAEYDKGDGIIYAKIIRPRYYFIIDESSEYFYTKEGKLYEKETGRLITDFIYTVDETTL